MESMYFNANTSDDNPEYIKDEEVINEAHDRLALTCSEFKEPGEADLYATYLLSNGIAMYNAELIRDIKRKKKLSYRLHKFFKQFWMGAKRWISYQE